jgi:AmiR/NasT family two-component response regulator
MTAGQLSAALTAAGAAAVALLQLDSGYATSFTDTTDGRAAYQMQVHQASGMVKVQAGVSIDEALLMLRAHAFATGRPVAGVAKDVVERRLRFPVKDR